MLGTEGTAIEKLHSAPSCQPCCQQSSRLEHGNTSFASYFWMEHLMKEWHNINLPLHNLGWRSRDHSEAWQAWCKNKYPWQREEQSAKELNKRASILVAWSTALLIVVRGVHRQLSSRGESDDNRAWCSWTCWSARSSCKAWGTTRKARLECFKAFWGQYCYLVLLTPFEPYVTGSASCTCPTMHT